MKRAKKKKLTPAGAATELGSDEGEDRIDPGGEQKSGDNFGVTKT